VPKLGIPKSEQYHVKTDINEASDKPQVLDMPLKESDIRRVNRHNFNNPTLIPYKFCEAHCQTNYGKLELK
jgi:hypothetical protein